MPINLQLYEDFFTIHRMLPDKTVPEQLFACDFYNISKTEDELSIVCPVAVDIDSEKCETGWRCIKVLGPLDFSLTGILAKLSAVLAAAEVSIFAVSTYDTDYILVKDEKLEVGMDALMKAGYNFK